MNKTSDILKHFHPLIQKWFLETVGTPTDVQAKSWPEITSGKHILITAPTGSGKTLTAFLWAINQFLTGVWETGATRILYVSPLKALNNDIRRNLITPLDELRTIFEKNKVPFPKIHVQTRSGDTPQSDRRRMLYQPPEILITTPESLNLLLSSAGGQSILTSLSIVILDEIHNVVGTKRGTYLITAVDRLVLLSGEFQRIALSATIKPLETVAEWIGGFQIKKNAQFIPRPVSIIQSNQTKSYKLRITCPENKSVNDDTESFWNPYAELFRKIIEKNRSTLLFTNSRRLCEKITLKINQNSQIPIAYSHHGSLSREIRTEVEFQLKAGKLKAIVATNSLEMGIDIGDLDEVLLIQSPPSISSAIQRAGRAGHKVGQTSRTTFFPTFSQDLLESAVLAHEISHHNIESIKPVNCPLDVLAQIIISMVGLETWNIDKLFDTIRTSSPYRNLNRKQFDLVLNMLNGRYANSRIRELKPKIAIDRLDNTASGRKGCLLDLYLSGGVIPDRGHYTLRHEESGARIGELDEEFVWEAKIGQIFALGTQNWRIQRITHNDVFVLPGDNRSIATPFWRAEGRNRDFHYAERIGNFLEWINDKLKDPEIPRILQDNYFLDKEAADKLVEHLSRQKDATGKNLPHRHHLLVETVDSGPGGSPGNQVILHTTWGGQVNQPFALALENAWDNALGTKLESYATNEGIILQLPQEITTDELLSFVTGTNIEKHLKNRLESSGFFGAVFRECAGTALLIVKRKFNQRLPLWMSRLRSQKLLNTVRKYKDFPIMLEAWRTCLQDTFDMPNLYRVIRELETGEIQVSECRTGHPSPMARDASFQQINQYMYRDDTPRGDRPSKLSSTLLQEVVFSPDLRPAVSKELIREFETKRQRLSSGYAPSTTTDLVDWVKERILIPKTEWDTLTEAIKRDCPQESNHLIRSACLKLAAIHPENARNGSICAIENLSKIKNAFYRNTGYKVESLTSAIDIQEEIQKIPSNGEEPEELQTILIGEWLQFYGPIETSSATDKLGIDPKTLGLIIKDLLENNKLISGKLIADDPNDYICDSENFEILLRMARKQSVPAFEALDIEWLPLFLAKYQGIPKPDDSLDGLKDRINHLLCYPTSAGLWEKELLPARQTNYKPEWIDALIREDELRWVGQEKEQIAFCFEPDLDLLRKEQTDDETKDKKSQSDYFQLFPDKNGRYDFSTLLKTQNKPAGMLSQSLWNGVWQGRVTNDTFAALRKGVENKFKVLDVVSVNQRESRKNNRRGNRTRFRQWKGTLPHAGNWFLLPDVNMETDLISVEERKKDRVRVLLDRYGILFRELLQRESAPFRWVDLFRSIRLMELSGEILSGHFFKSISGPQFMSQQSFRMLNQKMGDKAIYWIDAVDPASCCGIPFDEFRNTLPRRVESNHVVYRGKDVAMVSEQFGKVLTFHLPPDDPDIQQVLAPLHHLLNRSFQPRRRILIEQINREKAPASPYASVFQTGFDTVVDYKSITLYRQPN